MAAKSIYRERSARWLAAYANRHRICGDTLTIVNFGDREVAGLENAATFTGKGFHASGLSPTWTPSSALSAWATPMLLNDEDNWQGAAPVLTFDGANDYLQVPDDDFWSMGNGTTDTAGSFIAWVNMTSTTGTRQLWTKDNLASAREWEVVASQIDGQTLRPRLVLVDQSAGVAPIREADSQVSNNAWHQVIITYDGTGGATAANGITIYIDGASVASTATNNASYVAMENGTLTPRIGRTTHASTGQWFPGKMAGGPYGPAFCQVALTAAQVENLFDLERHDLEV